MAWAADAETDPVEDVEPLLPLTVDVPAVAVLPRPPRLLSVILALA